MAIKGRISNSIKETIIELHKEGHGIGHISAETHASLKQVRNILLAAGYDANDSDEDEESGAETLSEIPEDEEAFTDAEWAEFWKGKYLEAHAQMVIHGVV